MGGRAVITMFMGLDEVCVHFLFLGRKPCCTKVQKVIVTYTLLSLQSGMPQKVGTERDSLNKVC
jgi:hypothetical protein